ncbi:DNA-binding domain-containing protein [Salinarimonas chemoclinalis]|uniref:DNA-binding domain-containing protein n=1 Tax=Salinarimonas chemoclinalis TaxID=3241599 RepID=UPI003556FE6C
MHATVDNGAAADIHAIRRALFVKDQASEVASGQRDELSLRAQNASRALRAIATIAEAGGRYAQADVLNDDWASLMYVFGTYLNPADAEEDGEVAGLARDAADFFARLFFRHDGPSFEHCYKELELTAVANGWYLRGPDVLRRSVNRIMEVTS